jgi:hypothetical protein
LKRIAAAVCLAAIQAIPVSASVPYTVTPQNSLDQISVDLKNKASQPQGYRIIQFSSYENVGQLKLDSIGTTVDSIVLMRSSPDSDGVITVSNGALLDLKRIAVPVILRGLAFQLGPKGMLIAGAETGKENRNLVLDGCFIYADTLETAFLSWLADNASSIEIKNSFFVAKGAKASVTRINVTAGNVTLTNNLFNFPGAISAVNIASNLEIRSNTFNRTQLDLSGKVLPGVLIRCVINRNLFAHHGSADAFGSQFFWTALISGFDDLSSQVSANRMYGSWKGFDYPSDSRWLSSNTNVRNGDTLIDGKFPAELWNWYTEDKDSTTGLLSGPLGRKRYNVLPGEKSKTLLLRQDSLTAHFRPAVFPRTITLLPDNRGYSLNPAIRMRYAGMGALYFGPFRIDSLTMAKPPVHGKPVLLVPSDSGFVIQNSTTSILDANSRFVNASPAARYFILGDSANTPSGTGVAVGTGPGLLNSKERAVFARVDSAGATRIDVTGNMGIPPRYRYLNEGYTIHTTAKINSTIDFGGAADFTPFWDRDTTIYWMVKPDTFVKAAKGATGPDSGIYMARASINTELGDWSAYLVEKLAVPRDGTAFTLPGGEGEVHAGAAKGYQLDIDSAGTYDATAYGFGTRGYAFNWAGREDADTLFLILKAKPDQDAFMKTGTAIDPVGYEALPDSRYQIAVGKADSGKVFFVATKFNILANESVNRSVSDGVALSNYQSDKSGKLSFADIVPAYLDSLNASSDTTFRNTSFLGGKELRAAYLNPIAAFGMKFGIGSIRDTSKVETWSFDGIAWTRVTGVPVPGPSIFADGLPPATQRVIVVERLQAPENYVTSGKPVSIGKNAISVKPVYPVSGDTLRPVTGYCLQLQSVNTAGTVETTDCVQKSIGEETQVHLDSNSAYLYRIQYFMGQDKFVRPFELLQNVTWDPRVTLEAGFASLRRYRWHLLGFPFNDSLKNIVPKVEGDKLESDAKDETALLRITTTPESTYFEPMNNLESIKVRAGESYLLASAWNREIRTKTAEVLPPAPVTLALKKGWNFIANPFPISFQASRVQSKDTVLAFFELTYDSAVTAPASKYDWAESAVLKAYHGYAVHADTAEELVFDPFYVPPTAANPAAKSAAGSAASWLQARLESPWGGSKAILSGGAGQRNVRYLPTPGSGIALRIGGRDGYRVKAVRNLARVDEDIEITAPAAGSAAFRLSGSGGEPGVMMRLIDLTSGRVYDENAAASVALAKGSQPFRLLAGDAGFVEERTRTFLAGAPAEIGLSQNFPNPFRGKTAVALDWPVWNGGERRAVLEVLDMGGRDVARVRLDGIRMGRQVVTLDAAGWAPGIYLYRLTVVTSGKRVSLQKRMLVSP